MTERRQLRCGCIEEGDFIKVPETCPTCKAPLETVTTGGWIDKSMTRVRDDLHILFYGIFSEFEGLTGIFGWVEYLNQIPKWLFCRKGHIGLSRAGRIVR